MAVGVSPLYTSVPGVESEAAAGGTRHLVVGAPGPVLDRLLASLAGAGAGPVELVRLGPPEAGQVEEIVSERLAHARVGVRLHVAGTDELVRHVMAVGLAAGLQADEIGVLCDAERPCFRVACVHCHTINEHVESTLTACTGCGRTLLVYHHYSRRKAAYMGFQADAEVAGELPEAREGLPCP